MAAFFWTLSNVYREGDHLHLLHVVPEAFSSPAPGSVYYPVAQDPEVERTLWRQAEEFINEEFVDAARERGVAVKVVLVKESKHKHVGWAVCKKAEELEVRGMGSTRACWLQMDAKRLKRILSHLMMPCRLLLWCLPPTIRVILRRCCWGPSPSSAPRTANDLCCWFTQCTPKSELKCPISLGFYLTDACGCVPRRYLASWMYYLWSFSSCFPERRCAIGRAASQIFATDLIDNQTVDCKHIFH